MRPARTSAEQPARRRIKWWRGCACDWPALPSAVPSFTLTKAVRLENYGWCAAGGVVEAAACVLYVRTCSFFAYVIRCHRHCDVSSNVPPPPSPKSKSISKSISRLQDADACILAALIQSLPLVQAHHEHGVAVISALRSARVGCGLCWAAIASSSAAHHCSLAE